MGKTFEEVACAWHKSNRTWSNVHSTRILRSLEMYLFPSQPIAKITPADFQYVLKPSKTKDFWSLQGHFIIELGERLVAHL
ncbi:phage integrase central domain-containing protein [Serratia fonticola]|uniref:phage integrase central domain-containing protein n=1 Tax=Serratia fonticola TaxID=47917 RepID=UPI0036F3C616